MLITKAEVINQMYLKLVGSGYQITLIEEIKNVTMLLGNEKNMASVFSWSS